jgi:hypothetical protein
MNDLIQCPKCGAEIPVTEALARPFIEAEQARIEQELRQRSSVLQGREQELQKQSSQLGALQSELRSKEAEVEATVQQRLTEELPTILAAESKIVQIRFQAQLDSAQRDSQAQKVIIGEFQTAELEYRKDRLALDEEKLQLELNITRQIDSERATIRLKASQEAQKNEQLIVAEKDKELSELTAQLAESRTIELEVRKQRQALEQQKQALELEVLRRLDDERKEIRQATQKEESELNRLKFAEKDKKIEDLRRQAEELRRISEQGSQQLQGEVQERELEEILRRAFPRDEIEPIATGHSGGDIIQKVLGSNGLTCGTILWESKRTKTWSDAWLTKNKEDQRLAQADVGVIVSVALPKDVTRFDSREDVWVSSFDCAIPLATALRQALQSTALVQLTGQGRAGKADRAYAYITGQNFKHRVTAVAEAYRSMRDALEKERNFMNRTWARRQKDLDQIVENAMGLCGDLEGILCQSLPEIEGLELPRIEVVSPHAEDQLAELSRAQV